MPKRQC